jgi:hydrogenase-4 component E
VTSAADLILVLVVLTNLALLGSGRLGSCIRLSAAQGVLLSALPLLAHGFNARLLLIAATTLALKGFVFPALLFRAVRTVDVRHEVRPYVGYTASVLLGSALLALSFWLTAGVSLPRPSGLPLLAGLLLIIGRRVALMQVAGYLVLENGIYVFGVTAAPEGPFLIETGMLLDVFVAVFVMGITLFHIGREFDHIDADQLTSLKD